MVPLHSTMFNFFLTQKIAVKKVKKISTWVQQLEYKLVDKEIRAELWRWLRERERERERVVV